MELLRDLAASPAGLTITCAGYSMQPVVWKGQAVTVRAAPVQPGDVFLFVTGAGQLELHRLVVRLPRGWLVHRGDHQVVPGYGFTRAERVIGRAELARKPPRRGEVLRALAAATRAAPGALWRRRPAALRPRGAAPPG